MSLYAQYIRERENHEILENDKGFATYEFKSNGDCYLRDIFVLPEFRREGAGTEMSEQVEKIARAKNCQRMVGSVCVGANNCTESMKAVLAVGYKLHSVQGNMIYLIKELN